MWTIQASAISKASPETIWSHYSNVAEWNRWDDSIMASHIDGAFEAGSKGSMTIAGNPHPLGFEMLEVEANRIFRDVATIPGVSIEFTHTLEPISEGTKITHHVTISGPAWEQVAETIGKKLEQDLPHTVTSLAKLAAQDLAST